MTAEPEDEVETEEASVDVADDLEATTDPTERVRTGMDSVDSVVDDVAGLAGHPVEEHVQVFESAHERLRRTLDDSEPDTHQEP